MGWNRLKLFKNFTEREQMKYIENGDKYRIKWFDLYGINLLFFFGNVLCLNVFLEAKTFSHFILCRHLPQVMAVTSKVNVFVFQIRILCELCAFLY